MARTIGYSGILAIDYNKCQEVIDALTKAEEYAKNDRDCMINAQTYSEGCDGIGDAIPDAINNIKDKIERIAKLKVSFSNYVEKVKTFDSNFASGFTLNAFKNVLPQNQINLITNIPINTVQLEELVKKEKFCGMMEKCYGFDHEQALLILKAYDLSMKNKDYLTSDKMMLEAQIRGEGNLNYTYELTSEDKLKDFLKNISALGSYSGFQWYVTADSPLSQKSAIDYFKGIGMSDDEVNALKSAMITQHTDQTLSDKHEKDFAHEITELAAYSNENGTLLRKGLDIGGTFGDTNEMATFKGDIWSGAMDESDLLPDIDSVNIYKRMQNNSNSDFMDTFTNYNISVLNGDTNRSEEFCKNYGDGDLEKGKEKIKDIVDSWSPAGEYLTGRVQTTLKYDFNQIKDGVKLAEYINADPQLTCTKDEVDKIITEMNRSTVKYAGDIQDENDRIESAKKDLYNKLDIK